MHRLLKSAGCTVISAVLVASCDNATDPALPSSATKFTPPPAYAVWWAMTEVCSGSSGSLANVQWYEVADDAGLELDGKAVSAYWSSSGNRIVVLSSAVRNGQVVRHEMLHALLRDKGHSRDQFLNRCAGRVTCALQCIEDAGPGPGPSVPLPLSAMAVTGEVTPTAPRSSIDGGYFSVIVRVKNTTANPGFFPLPVLSSVGHPVSFSYQLFGIGGESAMVLALDNSAANFAAGETKIHVFDFFIGNGVKIGEVFAGVPYTVTGAYGNKDAASQSFIAQ